MQSPRGDLRLAALRRFALAITVFNLLGHTVFGFEESWAQPVVAVLTAYAMELLLELVTARAGGRRPRFLGGPLELVNFLLSPHITGLAVAMLLYANDRLLPMAFAAAAAIGSKYLFGVRSERASRHFFNPSNFGITATLLLFPWVGISQPYMFTENLAGAWHWVLPALIVLSGSFLNARFTGKVPLLLAWLGGFLLQAASRSLLFHSPLVPKLLPMTGVAFLLFTFYMVSDPATTPSRRGSQAVFGLAVALAYGALVVSHVVFGLFFALSIVCAGRGLTLLAQETLAQRARARTPKAAAPGVAPARLAAGGRLEA
jgi:hypothetical protein